MTELCSECKLEEIACRCPPPTASLMGLLRDFRNADAAASANGTVTAYAHGTAYGTANGEAAAADPDR
ncbi:MAG: hypothetical protein QOF81_1551 [Acidimicrobiaceae bacterium]|jgi:hypothetical protein|nr:hypothetical protein [Acidimicrobiaceae bacterium]